MPEDNKEECGAIEGIEIIPVDSITQLVDYLNGNLSIAPYKSNTIFKINRIITMKIFRNKRTACHEKGS